MVLPVLAPDTLEGLRDAVAGAVVSGTRLAVEGAGSKRGLGHLVAADATLSLAGLSGITYYEPGELVMEALAGTPLALIEAELAAHDQRLAFEPGEVGHLWGAGAGTIGGVFSCNLSGPRRPFAGAARDHLLGMIAVSGRGEQFSAGGRVVKNVTGYDMGKLLAGSFGTLAVFGRVTFKVLPRAEAERTVLVKTNAAAAALDLLLCTGNGAWDITGAAFLPRAAAARSSVSYVAGAGTGIAAIRLEGARGAVAERAIALGSELAALAPAEELHTRNSRAFWAEMRDGRLIAPAAQPAATLWRMSLPPAAAAVLPDRLAVLRGSEMIFDWQGGLVWLALPPSEDAAATASMLRSAATDLGGHAVLWRADEPTRARLSVFGEEQGALAALTRRVKANFDPKGILNPGRIWPTIGERP